MLDVWEAAFTEGYPQDSEITDLAKQYEPLIKEAELMYGTELDVAEAWRDVEDIWATAVGVANFAAESGKQGVWELYSELSRLAEQARQLATEAADLLKQADQATNSADKKRLAELAQAKAKQVADLRKRAELLTIQPIPGNQGTPNAPTPNQTTPDKTTDEETPDGATPGESTPAEGGQKPGGDNIGKEQCEAGKEFIRECELSGWQMPTCQVWLNKLLGCDVTLIDPGEGELCPKPQIDSATFRQALTKACGAPVSKPDSDGVISCGIQSATGAILVAWPKGCDPTVTDPCPDLATSAPTSAPNPPFAEWSPSPSLICPAREVGMPDVGCLAPAEG